MPYNHLKTTDSANKHSSKENLTPRNSSASTRSNKRPSIAWVLTLITLICVYSYLTDRNDAALSRLSPPDSNAGQSVQVSKTNSPSPSSDSSLPDFSPKSTDSTEPDKLIKETAIMAGDRIIPSYSFKNNIDFGLSSDYTKVQGIVSFRGNNFRDSASYGTANIVSKRFASDSWTVKTTTLQAPNGTVWTGSGWVGQPLIVTWPKDVRSHMNMYDWAKSADSLTEVIYATMDGNIYFLDLKTGQKTRNDLNLGYTFKGAGALDPRGYPIMYLGAGYDSTKGTSRVFIINLLNCSVMYEFGNNDSFSLRGKLSYFDGNPLVDSDTDQLIYPGENGIIYIMTLNTKYDPNSGTVSVTPSNVVKWRYNGTRTTKDSYWLGMEDSAVIWRSHLIIADNGGNLMCLNLKNLTLDWVQNVLDDTNCSPVLELENGHPYVYISTSFHAGWRAAANATADIPIWKIDADTGEIVWHTDFSCYTEEGVSGGVQGTLALGKNKLSDLIFVPVARTPKADTGILCALNKQTGAVVWKLQTQVYCWSSPVAVYDKDGNGYIVQCTAGGYMYLIDGLTGKVLDHLDLGGNVEASPAVYNSTVVVGTRKQLIWGVNLS